METQSEKETRRRALAAEGALLMLVDRLAMRGTISIDEGEEILKMISKASDMSAARTSCSFSNMRRLRQLRSGDVRCAPGAGGNDTN